MANTVIAIRASGTAAATPSLGVIANGEIALNYADGIIYYKTSSNTLGSIRTTQPAGLTTEVQYNDAGSFGSNANFTFNKTTGYFKAPIIESTNNGNGTNFKVGDDAWIGDINLANTLRIKGQQDSTKGYIVFGDSDGTTLGRSGTGALTYGGSFVANGELSTLNSVGDEGGQINFGIPQTNTTLNAGVVVDVYQNKLRFYESGGTNRGAYIDLTAASASVATNLLSGSGAVTSVAGATGAVSNNQILAGLLTVDGSGSGLDADLLDGLNSASFANAAFANTITSFTRGGTNASSYTTGTFLTSNGTAFVSVANTGTAGTYGNTTYIPVITTDAYGRVSGVTNTAISFPAEADTLQSVTTRGSTTANAISITNTTSSTSKTTGALIVSGGVGVSGDLYAGNSLVVDNGTYGNVTITQFSSVWGQAYGANPYSIMQVRSNDFRTGMGMQVYAGLNGLLYSNTGIQFNTSAITRDKDYPTGGTTAGQFAANGAFIAQASLPSTSNASGSIQVVGGAGVKGNVYADNVYISNQQAATIGDAMAMAIALG